MRLTLALPVILVLSLAAPVAAKDFFSDMIDALSPQSQQTTPRPKPTPKPVEQPDAAPVPPELPRPRPADLGDEAPIETPTPPSVAVPVPPTAPAKPEVAGAPKPAPEDEPTTAEPEPAVVPVAEPAPPVDDRVYQTACPALVTGAVEGKILPPIADGQCVAQSPLSVTGVWVNGRMVPLSGEVITDCAVATTLPGWIAAVDGYVFAKDNARIAEVSVGTSYMCRNRVGGSSTDKTSEHGFADALDVVGFKLDDGRTITVETGWTGSEADGSRIVRYAHDAACSSFMTTLGPEANAEHHDHIHVDMGCHGKTCTARLCE